MFGYGFWEPQLPHFPPPVYGAFPTFAEHGWAVTSTPGQQDLEAAHSQWNEVVRALEDVDKVDAENDTKVASEKALLADTLLRVKKILAGGDTPDPYYLSGCGIRFVEGQAFMTIWWHIRESKPSNDELQRIVTTVEKTLLDRFPKRAHTEVKARTKPMQLMNDAHYERLRMDAYEKNWKGQLAPVDFRYSDEVSPILRSRIFLCYAKIIPEEEALFRSITKTTAIKNNLPEGPKGYPARPARRSLSPKKREMSDLASADSCRATAHDPARP